MKKDKQSLKSGMNRNKLSSIRNAVGFWQSIKLQNYIRIWMSDGILVRVTKLLNYSNCLKMVSNLGQRKWNHYLPIGIIEVHLDFSSVNSYAFSTSSQRFPDLL